MQPRPLQKGEKLFVWIMTIVSLVALAASVRLFLTAPKMTGEGTIPMLTSLLMLIMSLVMHLEMRGCPKAFQAAVPLVQKVKDTFAYLFPGKVGLVLVYCLVYAVLLGYVGFVPSTFIFLAGTLITLNREHKIRSILISAGMLIMILLLFQFIFKVQLM